MRINIDGMFTVTFRRPFDFDKWVNLLSENRITILKAIHTNLDIKKSELEQIVRLSPTALDKNLDILKKEGLLEREGTKGENWISHYINPKVGE